LHTLRLLVNLDPLRWGKLSGQLTDQRVRDLIELAKSDATLSEIQIGVRFFCPLGLEPTQKRPIVQSHVIQRNVLLLGRQVDERQWLLGIAMVPIRIKPKRNNVGQHAVGHCLGKAFGQIPS